MLNYAQIRSSHELLIRPIMNWVAMVCHSKKMVPQIESLGNTAVILFRYSYFTLSNRFLLFLFSFPFINTFPLDSLIITYNNNNKNILINNN
jgi:hypothetical protein